MHRKFYGLVIAVCATAAVVAGGVALSHALLRLHWSGAWAQVLSLGGGFGFLVPAVALPFAFYRGRATRRPASPRRDRLPGATRFGRSDH
jgi:hypothetical protein